MAIFRGTGGQGDSTTDTTVSIVTQKAVEADASATAAASSATSAANSASSASTSETNAATSETNAATSATNASASETNAATSATSASASATTATTKASEASTSATSAATSATAAQTAQTAAETAQTAAETAETNASASATTATTKASEAATSATASATSATNAATSATSASTAQTAAETAQTAAETAKTGAETAETNAATSLDQFDDRYLGSKTSDPTLDNDGDALLTGALYWNSTDNLLKIYTGSAWVRVISEVSQDTTPELGGNLNLNSNDITGTGNINVTGTLQTSGNATIGGNLTVSGSTTTVNTEEINLADNNILLNSNHTGTPTQNAGLTVNRGNATNKVLQWNEASDYWEVDDAFNVSGNITVTGTVDGRDIATDGTKLDGIEVNATADQTNSEIKTAYENNSDTNAFTDAEKTKLSGIETGATADQTASEILTAIKTVDGSGSGLDADLLDGNQASAFATSAQGSTADSALQNVSEDTTPQLGGSLSTNGNDIIFGNSDQARFGSGGGQGSLVISATSTESVIAEAGSGDLTVKADTFKVTNANGLEDMLIATPDAGVALYHNDVKKLETTSSGATVTGALSTTGGVSATGDLLTFGNVQVLGTVDGRDVAADGTKLDGIEASADVTDATNVTAAGALMDSEVTNLAQVKAFASSDYATAAQGTTADNALPKAGGTMTGNIVLGDDVATQFGAGTDLVLKHNGTHSQINNNTGSLQLNQFANDQDVVINSDDGSGSTANYFRADGSTGEVKLYHYGTEKLKTQSGGVDVSGNINITGTLHTNSDAIIGGDLTVSGTTTTVNTETINLADNNIVLNSNLSSSTAPSENGGITINRGSATDKVFQWNESTDYWEVDDVLEIDTASGYVQIGAKNTGYTHFYTDRPRYYFNKQLIVDEGIVGSYNEDLNLNRTNNGALSSTERIRITSGTTHSDQAFDVTGNITVSGTVDGRDVAADGTKLDGIASSATANPNALDNVSEDTSPQLGGELDTQNNNIDLGTGTILLDSPAPGNTNEAISLIAGNNTTPMIQIGHPATGERDTQIAYDNGGTSSTKLVTTNSGIEVTGDIVLPDDEYIKFGASSDLTIGHISTYNANTIDSVGSLAISNDNSILLKKGNLFGENLANFIVDGAVELFYDNSKKFETTSTGIETTGTVNVNGAYTLPTSDGSANQILKTDGSGTLSFSADSGQTLIAQGTVNNATSIDFNSSILTGYDQYRIELTNVQSASDNVQLRMRFGTSNSADTNTGRYAYGTRFSGRYASNHYTNQMGTAWFTAGAASSYAVVAGSYANMGTNTGETLSTTLYLSNPNSTSKYKIARTETVVYSYFPMILDNDSSPVVYNQTSALNFVNFFASSGAISATYRVYGIS